MYGLQVSSWKSERHHPQRLVHLQLWCRILISRALVAPRFNTNTMKHSIAYRGSVLWNALTRMPWVITPVTVSQSSSCSMVGRRSGPIFLLQGSDKESEETQPLLFTRHFLLGRKKRDYYTQY